MYAKKSLGQNWLKSPSAVETIFKTAEIKAGDLVVEIGPGKGILTEKLLANASKVVAIEKDDRLIEVLREKFAREISTQKLILIHEDVLKIDFSDWLSRQNWPVNFADYKLVANIPYYITGQIIRKFLAEEKIQPQLAVLMLQKEVAKRIVASDNKESLLSLSVKAYGEPKFIKTIPAGAFQPKPKVDSAILLINNISRNFFKDIPEEKFFKTLKQGFSKKRKKLQSNLEASENIFTNCNLSINIRAENLNLDDWYCLTKNLKN